MEMHSTLSSARQIAAASRGRRAQARAARIHAELRARLHLDA